MGRKGGGRQGALFRAAVMCAGDMKGRGAYMAGTATRLFMQTRSAHAAHDQEGV